MLHAYLILLASSSASPTACHTFQAQRLVYLHIMKCGGLSVDALLRCRCSSTSTACSMLREDGSAKHAANSTDDLITRFRDTMLYGSLESAGGPACTAAGFGRIPTDVTGSELATRMAAINRRKVTHTQLLEAPGAPCAAQVLATHQTLSSVQSRPYWAGAHIITVLREPVARVWSFYQYVRRKQPEFQSSSLLVLLRRWRSYTPNGTAAGGFSPHMHWQYAR